MYLHELPVGSSVTLKVKVMKQSIEFPTHIVDEGMIEKAGSCAICNLIKINGKIVDLGHYAVDACITNVDDGRDYKYVITKISMDKKRRVLRIYSSATVKPQNYRNAFRVPCSYRAVMRIGDNRKVIDGFVHDISYLGAAYMFTAGLATVNVNDPISVTIYDDALRTYKVSGTIVRIVDEFKPDFTLVGVEFDKGTNFQKFVNVLQLRELRVRYDNKNKENSERSLKV